MYYMCNYLAIFYNYVIEICYNHRIKYTDYEKNKKELNNSACTLNNKIYSEFAINVNSKNISPDQMCVDDIEQEWEIIKTI